MTLLNKESPDQKSLSPLPSNELTKCVVEAALDRKARDVHALDLDGISDVADYFVLASGSSDRHVKGIADHIKHALKERGESPHSVEGFDHGEWILLDYGDVVVHVFYEPMRQYYNLDQLWANATQVELGPKLEELAKKLRTGMFPRPKEAKDEE